MSDQPAFKPPDLSRTDTPPESGGELTCANHPSVRTTLRCNRCGKPICTQCAVLTPVGYRCRECVRGQQAKFFNAKVSDYVIAAVVALPLGLLVAFAGRLIAGIGFFSLLLIIFGGPLAGRLVADIVFRAVGRRRGRYLSLVVSGSIAAAAVPFVAASLLTPLLILLYGADGERVPAFALGAGLLPAGFQLLFVGLVAYTAYRSLRFGR